MGKSATSHVVGPRARRALRVSCGLGVLAVLFHVAHNQLGLGGHSLDDFTDNWLYDCVVAGGAVSCLVRAWVGPQDRIAWLVLGAGLVFDTAGEVYYSIAFPTTSNPPTPSPADLFYLLLYPLAYAGLIMLMRRRFGGLTASIWLDGVIGAVAAAALIGAFVFEPVLHSASQGDAAAIATNLAYPIGDLILLGIVIATFALSGWRPGRAWLWLGLGFGVMAVADIAYAYANADGSYRVGDLLDSMWMASAVATGIAAWCPMESRRAAGLAGKRAILVPGGFALAALGVLVYGGFRHLHPLALILAAAALLLVIARAVWTFHGYMRLLERTRREAVTDALTGLGNRRRLMDELEGAVAGGAQSTPAILLLFDLDGFKVYNDRFGHLAGDTLLAHLGGRLQAAVSGLGEAHRLGGDEFCVLLVRDLARADVGIAAAVAALTAEGDGFTVRPSYGQVAIPTEAQTANAAMRIADDRMYAQKGSRTSSARQQSHNVLLEVLREREPELHHHLTEVGRLAVLVGRQLSMDGEQLDELRRAAELHDIGKAAIPDAILNKPGPLAEHEWAFMRRHTLVGERILEAAPALAPVALLVRSSHERWDGEGYPDRLAGEAIPLGSRIVAVCDAFDAMVSDRPYARPMTPEAALAELRAHAGAQFDPRVVSAFAVAWQTASVTSDTPEARDQWIDMRSIPR